MQQGPTGTEGDLTAMSVEVSNDGKVGYGAILAMRGQWWIPAAAIATVASILWVLTFVGYIASDDSGYLEGGRGWLHHFPFVGVIWWQLRHPIVVPIAVSIGLLGENEHALALPSLLYQIGIVLIAFSFLRRFADRMTAVVAAVLLVTLPVQVMQSSIANADIPMIFFASLSAWLFLTAIDAADRPQKLLLFASGASLGVAQLSHEISLSLVLVYGVLFLQGFGIARWRYWIMAGGFIAVTLLDMAYYGLAAGDPLYRFHITLWNAHIADRPPMNGFGIDGTGALRLHPVIDPFLVIFGRIDFGLLFFVFVPAAIWQLRQRTMSPARSVGHVMFLLAVVTFLFSAVTLRDKQLLTRYYALSAVAAAVVVALWMARALWPRHKRAFGIILAAMLGANLVALGMANKSPRFAEHALIGYLATHEGSVTVDPELRVRAEVLLDWAGYGDRVKDDPPKPGDVYYYNPRTASTPTPHLSQKDLPLFQPKADWPVLWRTEQEKSGMARLIQSAHLDRVLPGAIRNHLDHPSPAVTVLKVPEPRP